ncbi:MAG: autoinducer 2 ABC transporter substrate-binding protein [Lachnospiraceae bacterium]|nr:autoinducer 2 ABC transporter substrate-binding protein [Lachnospiraceae bacterium]
MKKKVVSILLTAAMAASCFSMVAMADEDTVQVAFVPQLIGIPYFTAMDEGGQRAAEDLGCEWIYAGDTVEGADLQVTQIDSLIRRGVDAISLAVIDSSATNPAIEKAQEAGIVAFTSDSDATDSTRDFYVAQADDVALGETLMEELAQQMGGEGKVGIVSGVATATNLNAWIAAIQDYAAENYPDIEILDVKYTPTGSSEEALQQAQDLMTANPDLKGLIGVASSTIPGVCQAVDQAGMAGEIKVTGYGSPATVNEYMKDGIMQVSVLWDAEALGYLTCWAGYQAVVGNEFEESQYIEAIDKEVTYNAEKGILLLGEPLIITPENVDDFDF